MSSEAIGDSLFSWVDLGGNTNTLDVDVVMASTDKRGAKLTDHVVEDGSVVTDNIIILPEQISLELVVSQTPVSGPDVVSSQVSLDTPGMKLASKTYPLDIRPSQFVPGGFLLLSQGVRTVVAGALDAVAGLFGASAGAPQLQGGDLQTTNGSVKATVLQNSGAPIDRVAAVHDQLITIYENALLVTVSFKGRLYVDYAITDVELAQRAGEFGMGRFRVGARAFRTVTATNAQLPDAADFRALPKVNKGNKATKTPDPDPTKGMKSILAHGADGDIADGLSKLFMGGH